MLRLAFLGIDHPHGAHWRQQLVNFPSEVEIVAFVPSFGGGTTSLEERYAELPRFDSVAALIQGAQFDAAVVCLSNHDGPPAIVDAVEKSGVAFQTGYMWRYDDIANRLKRMVEQGAFGKLINVEMTFVTS